MKAVIDLNNAMQLDDLETLRRKAERFDRFARSVPAVLYDYVIDADGTARCLYCSEYSNVLFGIAPAMVERDLSVLFDLIHPDDRVRFHAEDRRANRDGKRFFIELKVVLTSGEEKWLRISSRRNAVEGEGPAIWSGYMIDISDTKRAQALLQRRATHDYLTGLANRQLFQERCAAELARAKRYRKGHPASVLLLDIDHFKNVNDRFGHETGDHVLRAFAGLLAGQVRAVDTLARWGGEEFTALLPETARDQAADAAERIRIAVENHRFDYRGHSIGLTVSIGAAVFDTTQDDVELVVRRADEALYEAKRAGRNRVVCG